METIPVNAVYQADCLALLERVQTGQVTLAYVDAPWEPESEQDQKPESPIESESLQEYLMFLSHVLQQTRRVLSEAGSLFFHSEPRLMGHIRLILDQVFGRDNFRTDIVWPRLRARDTVGPKSEHDTILLYSRSDSFTYNRLRKPLSEEEVRSRYTLDDNRGLYRVVDLTSYGDRPYRQFEWKGTTPLPGRSWRYSEDELDRLDREGKIHRPSLGGLPKEKQYLDEYSGLEVGSVWDDIPRVLPRGSEDFRYQGQRPIALLERILRIGSNEGDLILDPFCGTGTALVAAQANGRRWLGGDLSPEACSITVSRLESTFDMRSSQDFIFGQQGFLERYPIAQNSYASVITGLEQALQQKFFLHRPLQIEETRHYEFKEIKGASPVNRIKDAADEYGVAFLNSEGGRIYWGIRDSDRVVVGVRLTYAQRDEIRRVVTEKLTKIQPAVAPTAYRIELHQVYDQDVIPDLYVVEIVVPRVSSTELYFTGKGDAWVKTDGGKKRLMGPEILEEYRRRLPK